MSLDIRNPEHFDEVCKFADKVDLRDNLDKSLKFLHGYQEPPKPCGVTRCELVPDFAPYSFYFVMKRKGEDGEYRTMFNGGLIFHGPHDGFGSGEFPTLSVSLSPSHGWEIHT